MRRLLAIVLLASAVSSAACAQGVYPTLKISPGACTMTYQTVIGTSGTLIAATPAAKYEAWMNVGPADITVVPGTAPPTVGQGIIYQGQGTGKQGGSEAFSGSAVPTNGFAFSASTSATIAVEVCQ